MSVSPSELARGFRQRFLGYDELTAQLEAWVEAFPALVRLESIGTTPEQRTLWVLTIGPDPDRVRPAVWVDGNMHAAEVCGSSVALAIAEDLIGLHLDPDATAFGLPAHVCDVIRETLVYVMPRMSPDGVEAVLSTGKYVRSSPADERANRGHARWISADVNGDGVALVMRKQDACGEFVESTEVPGLMLLRTLEDTGPFYKIYPEGHIENYDGHTIPTPYFLSDNQTDLNRNFPWSWAPEPDQAGAGAYPTSEPESRAVVEFTSGRPNIFAWLNLHTFGGVFIRPLGHLPDSKMDQSDLALFRQIAQWNEDIVGYPTVSGFEEFTYEPDKPLHGDLTDYAFHQRGAIAYVCELWDLFAQLGIERKKRFVDHYTQLTREELIALGRWDSEHNEGRAVRPWVAFDHPQLGAVEVGGVDPRVGLWNPPYDRIDEVCRAQAAALFRVIAMAPRVVVADARTERLGNDATRVDVSIENRGYLPTYVLSSARKLDWNEPLYARVQATGCSLADPGDAHTVLTHLDGWGRGRFDGSDALYHMRSRGNTSATRLRCVVRGHGTLTIRVGSCRVGWIEHTVDV